MDNKNYQILYEYLNSILYDSRIEKPDLASLESPYEKLGRELEVLQRWMEEMHDYSEALSEGRLPGTVPSEENPLWMKLKNLHVRLKEQENRLKEEKAEIERQAEVLDSYNGLLLELTRKQREWIIIVDAATKDVVYCNKCITGYKKTVDKEFCKTCGDRVPFMDKILDWEEHEQFHVWEAGDGDCLYYRVTTFPLKWKKRKAYAHILMDITDEKLEARSLQDKAYHDALTGIYNRIYFDEYMDKVLWKGETVILGYLDLDCLKTVNDQFGHGEGDKYIHRFVSTVQKYFRTTDVFARIGGDEFCLVLNKISKQVAEEKLAAAMAEFQSYRDKEYIHGFSFGVTEVRGKEEKRTLPEIINQVDAAMYECKRKNKELYKSQREGRDENPGN